jgi:hypothetical protein
MRKMKRKVKGNREQVDRQKRILKTATEKAEVAYGIQLRAANTKNDYITNLINGRYYLARCNTITEQLRDKKIEEKLDGRVKTEEYLRAEYALQKMLGIKSMRNAYFAKQELLGEFKLTEKQIAAIEKDYYDGRIIREVYDEQDRKKTKAEFVNTSKD